MVGPLFRLLFLCVILTIGNLHAINVITFFFRPCVPTVLSTSQKSLKNVYIPGKISAKTLKYMLSTPSFVQGVFASYWGYLRTGNQNGQVLFPRKQRKASLTILVTSRIKPVMMIGRTIHHWEIDPSVATDLYQLDRIQDEETKKYYWLVQPGKTPENNIIGLDTIIIFAQPKHIIVPLGKFKTKKTAHLYLPDIYVKKGINNLLQSLWVLKIKNFFSLVDYDIKKQLPTYTSLQVISS